MTPISEADPEVRAKVVAVTGECRCGQEWRDAQAFHIKGQPPRYDPTCGYHQFGEHFANLFRENRRLRGSLARLQEIRRHKSH